MGFGWECVNFLGTGLDCKRAFVFIAVDIFFFSARNSLPKYPTSTPPS